MKTSISYWEKQHFFTYDVIIIGSGIVGLNAAVTIKSKNPKASVAILERGFLPSGASTKNAGFACFGSISELIEQEKNSGTALLYELIERRWKGLLKLRKLLGDDSLSYHNYGGYELFKKTDQQLTELCVSKISHFNELIKDIVGQENTFRTANSKISSFGLADTEVLIENQLEAQINTGKMMKALIQKAAGSGVMVYNNCEVNDLREEENNQVLVSNHGNFKAKHVLLSTNAFVKHLIPDLDVVPGRGQVILTNTIPNLKIKGTFHYDKGYYYFRNIDNRILLGGGRNLNFKGEETTLFGSTTLIQDALKTLLKEVILPHTPFKIEQSWSGIMAFGHDIYPIVKAIRPGVFCAVRCNGMGIAMGSQTGEDAANLILPFL
ncbi:NAD(P)/FAD-dependent oxidoreductase [Pedobacter caeni]|uniref:Glycine/D-amino acid oxidase n=1 Tax=Pedobacter caeni TaxID=288992 RepID=A0A1M5MHV3_9SPHI|nr:FAD-binding oxidoreductase [Pedobacter caeni]SHG76910.1 Glycine/D-amino acid oxidase [Pedobacter caeni]